MYKNYSEIISKDSWQKTVIQSRVVVAVIPFFIGIELIQKSSCSHLFELPFLYYKRVIAATHSIKFTCFCRIGIEILTIIIIPPWFKACIYWKKFCYIDDIIYSHPFFVW